MKTNLIVGTVGDFLNCEANMLEALLTFIYGRWHRVHTTLMRRRVNGAWEYRAATDEEGGLG